MKLQLYLNYKMVIEQEITIDPEEQEIIDALPIDGPTGRVEYMEKLFHGHGMEMKGKFWEKISKAKSYQIVVVLQPKKIRKCVKSCAKK